MGCCWSFVVVVVLCDVGVLLLWCYWGVVVVVIGVVMVLLWVLILWHDGCVIFVGVVTENPIIVGFL